MKKVILWAFALLLASFQAANAELSIDITGARSEPMATGLPAFSAGGKGARDMGDKIARVIESDLESSGLFRILDSMAYLQTFKGIGDAPVFVDWQAIKAEALIQGHVDYISDRQIRVSIRLWDVYAAQELYSATLEIDNKGWRRAAHMIADAVYKRITGEEGYFDTRIVYIAETGSPLKRIKRLAIMDQDGENHQFLTDGLNLVLTPRFSPNMQQITYLSFYKDTPRVYLFDIETGKQQVVGDFPGMTFAPRFSPDGHKLFRQRPLRDAGLVAARRLHRLYENGGRQVLHRRDVSRRPRRTAGGRRLSGRSADMVAERAHFDVFPSGTAQPVRYPRRDKDLRRRYHGV